MTRRPYFKGNSMDVVVVLTRGGNAASGGSGTCKLFNAAGTEIASVSFAESPSGTYTAEFAHSLDPGAIGAPCSYRSEITVSGRKYDDTTHCYVADRP